MTDAMLDCIGPDLWEEALLRPMDFGHSFSRTLEADERFYLRHGEAVAIDCVLSTLIAEVKGHVSAAEAQRTLDLYARLGLPCSMAGVDAGTYKRAAREITVHRDGLLRAPLPAGIGRCTFVDEISDGEIDTAFARLQVRGGAGAGARHGRTPPSPPVRCSYSMNAQPSSPARPSVSLQHFMVDHPATCWDPSWSFKADE